MTAAEIITLFRHELDDTASPYQVSDELALAWLNMAEVEACRRAHLLQSTYSISITSAAASYALDAKVIMVRRVKAGLVPMPLRPISYRDLDENVPNWEAKSAGKPVYYFTDMATGYIGVHPKSSSNDTLSVLAVSEPTAITSTQSSPTIAPRYHAHLVHWMLHMAYLSRDQDIQNQGLALQHLQLFETEFGPRDSARNEAFEARNYPYDNFDGSF